MFFLYTISEPYSSILRVMKTLLRKIDYQINGFVDKLYKTKVNGGDELTV